jgi:uncharacterized membrane protein
MSQPSQRFRSSQRPAWFLAGLLGTSGVLHFARPKFFDASVPKQLPGSPRQWTQASGIAELAVAAAITVPRTRRLGGLTAALLFVGVFPANVKMALDAQRKHKSARERLILWVRLPVQWPLVTWALKVRDSA